MLLTEIGLEEFKAYSFARIKTAPLTVLIGPNNGGKSSVLQPLALLAQTVAGNLPGRLQTNGPIADLGDSLEELARDAGDARADKWSATLTWKASAEVKSIVAGSSTDLQVGFQLTAKSQVFPQSFTTTAWVSREIPVGRPILAIARSVPPDNRLRISGEDLRRGTEAWDRVTRDFNVNVHSPWHWSLGEHIPTAEEANSTIDAIAYAVGLEAIRFLAGGIEHQLQAFRYVGANRQITKSLYPLGGGPVANPQTAEEIVNELAFSDELLARVSDRLTRTFGLGVDKSLVRASDFRPAERGSLVGLRGTGRTHRPNLVNLGAGFTQFAWVALELEKAREFRPLYQDAPAPTPIVGVEEPELHLHPKLQPAMARLLVEFANAEGQVICTTQSEHFLLAVLELVLDQTLQPEQLSVIYVDAPNGVVDHLEVDANGQLRGGLKGFFEENERQIERQIDLLRKSAELDS